MFFLVTGANGAGQSTDRRALAPALERRVDCAELAATTVTAMHHVMAGQDGPFRG
jgi:hypothetical protein